MFRKKLRTKQSIHPLILYPSQAKNKPVAIYYGTRNYSDIGVYSQEVTVVFCDETHPRALIDKLYRLYRRIRYGRSVDIESFIMHIKTTSQSPIAIQYKFNNKEYCDSLSFIDIYANDDALWETTSHETAIQIKRDSHYTYPFIYVRTWNHAMSTYQGTQITRWLVYASKDSNLLGIGNIESDILNRSEVERKYRNWRKKQ